MRERNAVGDIIYTETFGDGTKDNEFREGRRYDHDSWGTPKIVQDYKVFSDVFSTHISNRKWEEGIIVGNPYDHNFHTHTTSITRAISTKGTMELSSGTTTLGGSQILSKKASEYEPNKGHKYSSGLICPNPDDNGFREFGFISHDNGIWFRQSGDGTVGSAKLEVCVLSSGVLVKEIDVTNKLPDGFDFSKGHLYDIQLQLRFVGDFIFYVDLEPIFTIENLGTLEYASITDANLQAGYRCYTNDGTDILLRSACVEIVSEGGTGSKNRQYDDLSTFLSGLGRYIEVSRNSELGTATIGMKLPRHYIYDGVERHMAKDVVITQMTNFCADESGISFFVGRDTQCPNLDAIVDNETNPLLGWKLKDERFVKYMIGGNGTALDTAFKLDLANMKEYGQSWTGIKEKNVLINPGADKAPFELTSGDYLVVRVISDGNSKNCNCSIAYNI